MKAEDIRLIQLNNYVKPKLVEDKAKDWVLNGVQNKFYEYIIKRNNGSVTNSAINKSYADLIYGKGLSARDAHLKPSAWASFISMIKPQELKKIIADFQVFGEASMQLIKNKGNDKYTGIYHFPKQNVAPQIEDNEGYIKGYWYCKDWTNTSKYPPEYYPAFGTKNSKPIEIYVIKPYSPGCNYFSNPDYLAGLQWAELEEEISNFCNTAIKNGLTAGYLINIPDGQTLTPEEKEELENKIKKRLTGSVNALRFIISFNSKETEITIVPFPVNEQQHKQWDFLTEQSRQQIMTAHRVVSPMLLGIKDSTGLGNNADELDKAEAQLMKRVIAPKQQYIIDALSEIISFNDLNLDLYFRPLTELQSSVQMSAHDEKKNLDTNVADELIKLGEDGPGEDWELIETKIVHDYEADMKFTSTGTAIPNAKSSLDGDKFKTRFRYVGNVSSNTRQFCQKMISANKIYRLEDINRMSNTVVNEGWGPGGSDIYDIFLYKGGGNCKHAWQKEIYQLKADVNNPRAKTIMPSEASKEGDPSPKVDKKASVKPADMPNRGFLNK